MPQNKSKSLVHELKGDTLVKKNKYAKALEHYQKAVELNSERVELYDKLIEAHKESLKKEKWNPEDLAYSLSLTMKKQELLDPKFKRIHAQQDPQYKKVTVLVKQLLSTESDAEEGLIAEAIAAVGTHAIYPLIDFILNFKAHRRQKQDLLRKNLSIKKT